MLEAAFGGLLGASSLLLGAALAAVPSIHRWLATRQEWRLGMLVAFGSCVLIPAVAYSSEMPTTTDSVAPVGWGRHGCSPSGPSSCWPALWRRVSGSRSSAGRRPSS